VEQLIPLSIVSVSPRNEFFQALSWEIDVAGARRRLAGGAEPLVFGVHGGPASPGRFPIPCAAGPWSMLSRITLQVNTHLENNYALGIARASAR